MPKTKNSTKDGTSNKVKKVKNAAKVPVPAPVLVPAPAPAPVPAPQPADPEEHDATVAADATVSRKKKKSSKKSRSKGYSTYIFHVMKQVHPEATISSNAMAVMNSFVGDLFDRIAGEAGHLAKAAKKPTMSSWDIQSACKLLIPGELAKHAKSEGAKAVATYESSKK